MAVFPVPDHAPVSSPAALRFLEAVQGRLTPQQVGWDQDGGVSAADIGQVVATALGLLGGADGPAEYLARQALLQVGAPTWSPEKGRAYLTALRGLRALPGYAAPELVACVVDAISALASADREVAAEVASVLVALARAQTPAAGSNRIGHEAVLTLACVAGAEVDAGELRRFTLEIGQPLCAIELGAIARLPFEQRRLLTAFGRYRDDDAALASSRLAAGAALAADPAWAAAARAILEGLAERLGAIHGGRLPYAADRAAGEHEIVPVIRAFAVASAEDAPWLGELAGALLPRLVVAPRDGKTLPSQALAVALSRTTAERPTPETLAALEAAARLVRHVGIKKKLERDLRAARKALSGAARLIPRSRPPEAARPAKAAAARRSKELTSFRAALEASFDAAPRPARPWLSELLADPVLGPDAAGLIWTVAGPREPPVAGLWRGGGLRALDGREVPLTSASTIRPWHPVAATPEERAGWCDLLVRERRRQPIRQAFREWYRPSPSELGSDRTSLFAGIVASARPLAGLARREGWKPTQEGLRREVGAWAFVLLTGAVHVHPGLDGPVPLGDLVVERLGSGGGAGPRLQQVPPITLSEALRAADLLASVAGFGVEDGGRSVRSEALHRLDRLPLRGQSLARRRALELVLRAGPEAHRLRFEERHLVVSGPTGEHRLHYATGLVVGPDGAVAAGPAVEPAAARPLPWLPYDEALLERLVRQALTLLDGA